MAEYYTYGTNLQDREFFTSTVQTNNGIKRYFSNIESEIYFGNRLMEDIYKFDFMVEEKKLPIYGYNCFYPEIIVPGQRIVQGSFIINFTDGAFMRDVLESIDDSIMCNSIVECETYNPSGTERDTAIFNKSFDITIGYGYYKTELETYNATAQTICGVQLVNMQTVVDVTGEPIMEAYSFIAKDYIDVAAPTASYNNNQSMATFFMPSEEQTKYIYADKNNKDEYTQKYTEAKNNSDALCLVHDIKLSIDKNKAKKITVIITDFNNNPINCDSVILTINEQLDYNFTTYQLNRNSTNKFVVSFENMTTEGNILYEAFTKKDYDKISCTLKYSTEFNNEIHQIKYDGYIYPDTSIINKK